jgi:hypothetical protein
MGLSGIRAVVGVFASIFMVVCLVQLIIGGVFFFGLCIGAMYAWEAYVGRPRRPGRAMTEADWAASRAAEASDKARYPNRVTADDRRRNCRRCGGTGSYFDPVNSYAGRSCDHY